MRAVTRSYATVAARLAMGLVLSLPVTARGDAPPAGEPAWTWAAEALSPRPVDLTALPDREAELQRECGRGDVALQAVAARLVTRKLRELPYLDAESIGQMQRVAGEPHVWPRSWMVSGLALDHESTREKLGAWAASFHEAGDRRCGLAVGYGADGTEVVAAVALDALADLHPLPTRVHVGAWLPLEARLLVTATSARVIVMGPTGRPRTVPTQLDGTRVRAQIALDQPGAFTVQVVADVAAGPRPVLEAELFADATPWTRMPDLTVPGEAATRPSAADRDTLLTMIQSMRTAESLAPFTPDARLDALAVAHAERMQHARALAHDVGDGDPVHRLEGMHLRAHESGENVAHAGSVLLAHRALYASPSHRTNLLGSGFDRVGVGVATDADGSVWVAEEFADGLR